MRHQNHTWLTPLHLTPGATPIEDLIEKPYGSRWYVLEGVAPGDEVTVTVTDCPVDLTLLGFTDVREKAEQILDQLGTTGPLDAEDMDSEDMDSEDMDSEDMDSEDMDSEDMDSEDMDSEDMDSDDMDSEDMDSDDMDSGDLEMFRNVYASAQRHSLRAASVTPGVAPEQIHMVARAGGGDLYFRVRGHLGAFDACEPYRISARVRHDDVCKLADLEPRWSPLPNDVRRSKTLILTHTGRLGLRGADRDAFLARLRQLAAHPQVDGAVYDLRRDRRLQRVYRAWERAPKCVPQANAVVASIRAIVGAYAKRGDLKYLVIVGSDDVVPFARIEDRAEIAREWQWAGPYDPEEPLGAALTYGFYLSDDPYGRLGGPIDARGKGVQIPTIAAGRLVETRTDIEAYVNWFLGPGASGIRMRSALSAGYTFVRDLAQNVAQALEPGGIDVDKSLAKDVWSLADLLARLPGKDVVAAQGHYSANTYLAADGRGRLRPEDLTFPGAAEGAPERALEGVLWTTIGCHSAHHVVARETRSSYAHKRSWSETLLRQGATLVGGTGYQYAESVLPANSERLYTYLAEELVASRTVRLGDALNSAKRRYLTERSAMRGMDQKILEVATLYGLPMLRMRVDEALPGVPIAKVRAKLGPSVAPGLRKRAVALRYDLTRRRAKAPTAARGAKGAHYLEADTAIARPFRPVLPAVVRDITSGDRVPTGVIWTGGRYREYRQARFRPAIAVPVVDGVPKTPRYRNRALLPTRPFRIARVGGRHTLVFTAVQYRYDGRSGLTRRWESVTSKLYYSDRTDETALHDAPRIESPRVTEDGTGATVVIDVRHHASAKEHVEAFVSYLEHGRLRTVALAPGPSHADGIAWVRRFRGAIPDKRLRVFFQAAGGNGRVSWLTNGGHLFGTVPRSTPAPTKLALKVKRTARYRDHVDVTATLATTSGRPVNGEVLFQLRRSRIWVRARGGVATARLTVTARPRTSPYLVIASFPGTDGAAAAAASRAILVRKARTAFRRAEERPTLHQGAPKEVGTLHLSADPRPLGGRAVTVTRGRHRELVYTDAKGRLMLLPGDIAATSGSHSIRLSFAGDAAYEGATRRVRLDVAPAANPA